jgi:hypothetical protein
MRVLLFIAYPAKKEGTTMKSMTTKLMVTAAAMLTAGLASAQSVKAQVPFAFRAAGAVMPAGVYRVTTHVSSSPHLVYVENERSLRSVVLVPQQPLSAKPGSTEARLVFRCEGEDCSLTQIWAGGANAFQVAAPKSPKHADAAIRIVTLRAERAD